MRFIAFDPTTLSGGKSRKMWRQQELKTAITEAGTPAPGIKCYVIQNPENLTEFEMLFTSDQVGKTFYIICYYLNARNEAGKDGLPYSVTII